MVLVLVLIGVDGDRCDHESSLRNVMYNPAAAAVATQSRRPPPTAAEEVITSYTPNDVLNGRVSVQWKFADELRITA